MIKVGDVVRQNSNEYRAKWPQFFPPTGTEGTVIKIDPDGDLWVHWPQGSTSDDDCWCIPESQVLAVEDNCLHDAKSSLRLALTADIPLARLEQIVEAERDGRCKILPCKVGDTVYAYVDVFNRIGAFKIDSIEFYGLDGMCCTSNWVEHGELMAEADFDASDIDKTVFLSYEAAAAALRKEQANDQT